MEVPLEAPVTMMVLLGIIVSKSVDEKEQRIRASKTELERYTRSPEEFKLDFLLLSKMNAQSQSCCRN
jgi:DNA/RNA-binding domain of Phe-tRNA-synthetase-like protein